jgi:hydroxymethylpyrimidine pyrophosphatase-like HAD family hydrolase
LYTLVLSGLQNGSGEILREYESLNSAAAAACLAPVTHIYTDLDGTMLAPGGRLLTAHDGTPSAALAVRLVALKQAGIEIIAVTGRNRAQGTEIIRMLNLQTLIGELGTIVQDGYGANAVSHYNLGEWASLTLAPGLSPGELPDGKTPANMIQDSGVIARLEAAFPGKLELHNPYRDSREVTIMLRGCIDATDANNILACEQLPLQLSDNGIIHPQKHTLKDCSQIHVYHLMPRGTSKAAAVAANMRQRGISREQTVALGDASGDIQMGEHTGCFVWTGHTLPPAGQGVQAPAGQGATASAGQSVPAPVGGGVPEPSGQNAAAPAGQGGAEGAAVVSTGSKTFFVSEGRTADGWAEFADALLAAKAR